MDHPHILHLSAVLTGLGLTVVRFDFPYRKRGKAPPDPMPVLVETIASVAAAARKALSPEVLILAGHSMGGRAASMAVADGLAADGLLLFSYPWHPPGKPESPRTAHLDRIRPPVLGFTGTRDAFCDRNALAKALSSLPPHWTQVFIEGADHGLDVLKRSGRTRAEVLSALSADVRKWLAVIVRGTGGVGGPAR
jgi:predicted alpha/beta-hydrolase family hydrolase